MPKYLTQIDGIPVKAERSDCDGQGNDISSTYQAKLTAGSGIAISSGNVISATGSSADSCEFNVLYNADGTYNSLIIDAANLADGRALVKGDSADDVHKVALGTLTLSDNVTVTMDDDAQGKIDDTVAITVTVDNGYRLSSVNISTDSGGKTYTYSAGLDGVSLANGLGSTSYAHSIEQGSNLVDVTATAVLFNSVSFVWESGINYYVRLRSTSLAKSAVGVKITSYQAASSSSSSVSQLLTVLLSSPWYCTSAWSTSGMLYGQLELHAIYTSSAKTSICGFAIYRSNGTTISEVICGTSTSYVDSDVYPYDVNITFYVCSSTDCTSELSDDGFSANYYMFTEA